MVGANNFDTFSINNIKNYKIQKTFKKCMCLRLQKTKVNSRHTAKRAGWCAGNNSILFPFR